MRTFLPAATSCEAVTAPPAPEPMMQTSASSCAPSFKELALSKLMVGARSRRWLRDLRRPVVADLRPTDGVGVVGGLGELAKGGVAGATNCHTRVAPARQHRILLFRRKAGKCAEM